MKLSLLNELPTTREMISVFGGYNHNLRIGDGEFYDMKNLTSADYPVLSPRPKRGIYTFPTTTENPTALLAKDALCYVDGGKLYINKKQIDCVSLYDSDCKSCPKSEWCSNYVENSPNCIKTLVSMGSYIVILPDKYYINTNDYDDRGYIDKTFAFETDDKELGVREAVFSLCNLDGADYNAPAQPSAPTDPKNLDYWLDTSSEPNVLKQYASSTEQWAPVATTYIKIRSYFDTVIDESWGDNPPSWVKTPDISQYFEVGDGITISGITTEHMGDSLTPEQHEQLNNLNNTMVIQAKGKNYIVVIGMIDKTYRQDCVKYPIEISRKMPALDFIIESGNRLWGCRHGVANNGEVVNEIYASKLGDPKNWNSFAGISTDSYVATVGTDGQFTGAIAHLGYPIFFKEKYMHKVYGNYPANYQIQTTACRGVQKGCSKSLAIVNETLFYKSRSAVCAYDGSLPVEVSSALGDVSYSDAVAGTLGNKYYISMKDSEDYHLFVFDTARGMWHREDNTRVTEFCNCRGNLYYIDYADKDIKMIRMEKGEDTESNPIEWKAVTGIIGTDYPDKKYISSLVVRIMLEVGTTVRFSAEYDSSGEYEHLFTMSGTKLRSFSIPIRPKRCDHLRLKIEGKGMAKIYSICKTIEQGSDV